MKITRLFLIRILKGIGTGLGNNQKQGWLGKMKEGKNNGKLLEWSGGESL